MKLRDLAPFVCAIAIGLAAAVTRAEPAPSVIDVQGGQIRVVTVATGLVHPWSIALLPEDRSMLVAERSGQIRLIRNDALLPEPVWSAAGVAANNELKWLALHPRFAANQWVYLSYAKGGELGTTLAVARGRFEGRWLHDVEETESLIMQEQRIHAAEQNENPEAGR